MIALMESYDVDASFDYPVSGRLRSAPVSRRTALAAKRNPTGRERLAAQARYRRRSGGSFMKSSRQRPCKVLLDA